jgi:F-type H+-transporting ATPase subunit b
MGRSFWTLAALLLTAPLLAIEAEAEGHEALKPVIPPTVWGILIFATVLIILWRKAYPPILAALEKRERMIRESLEAAQRAKVEAEAMMKKHEESLEKARIEARAIIEESKTAAVRVKDEIVQSAKRESEELVLRAKRDIEIAKRAAVGDLHRQAVRLSVEIAEKLIKKKIEPDDQDALIQESIRKFQQVPGAQ